MMMSKSGCPVDEDGSCANIVNTIVTNTPSQKQIRLIMSLEGIQRLCRRKSQCKIRRGQRYLRSKAKSHAADRATCCESYLKAYYRYPRYSESPASQMEPKRITTWKFLNRG